MNKLKAVIFLIALTFLNSPAAAIAEAGGEASRAAEAVSFSDKVRVRLEVAVEAFNLDAKAAKALEKKIESHMLSAILKHTDAALADKNYDAVLSVRLKTAASFAGGENDSLYAMSCAGSPAAGGGQSSVHELACFQMQELKKNCESAAASFGEKVLACVKAAKIRQAAVRAAEEKKRREEYAAALKKQEEARKAEDIKEWKKKKYEDWKSGRSMSILDEELEAAGVSFEQLIKEFKEMSAAER